MIPYTRFKEVNDEKNELKNQLSNRDTQLKELDKITKDNEELNSKIKELQESNKNVRTEYENDKLVGLDEQLKALKESDAYLFKVDEVKKYDLIYYCKYNETLY